MHLTHLKHGKLRLSWSLLFLNLVGTIICCEALISVSDTSDKNLGK